MSTVLDNPETEAASVVKPKEEKTFKVFMKYNQPKGLYSWTTEDMAEGSCVIYRSLGEIFGKSPYSIYQILFKASGANGQTPSVELMQEYSSEEKAHEALSRASICKLHTRCGCFFNQDPVFYID